MAESDETVISLPSNHEVLSQHGRTFHFFVDSAEGSELGFVASVVESRADAADRRADAAEQVGRHANAAGPTPVA